jgi:hypothetical protein
VPTGVSSSDLSTTEAANPPRRWNRGLWIRFALAITPLVVFAILGYLQTH